MPALPPEFEAKQRRAEAAITRELAAMAPDERSEKLNEIRTALLTAIELDFVSEDEQKAQLRRLGCTADLDKPGELLRELWAAAKLHGSLTDSEFWLASPRDVYALLELKVAEIDRAGGQRTRSRKRAGGSGREETQEERAARRQAVFMPILEEKEWTRGKLCTESGVGKATVYGYLDGSRKTIEKPNRDALADALEIDRKDFPV
jgi:hypothetical protein